MPYVIVGLLCAVVGFVIWMICHYWSECLVVFAVLFGVVAAVGLTFVLNMFRRSLAGDDAMPGSVEDFSAKEYVGFVISILLGGVAGYLFGFGCFCYMLYTLGGIVVLSMVAIVWRGIVESKRERREYALEQRGIEKREREETKLRQERRRRAVEMEERRLQALELEKRKLEEFVQSLYDMRVSQKDMMALRALCDKRGLEMEGRWGDCVEDVCMQVRDVTAWEDVDRRQTYDDALEGDELLRFVKKGGKIGDVIPPHAEIKVCFSIHGARYKAYLRFNEERVFFARFSKDRISRTRWDDVLKEIDSYVYAGEDGTHRQSTSRDTRW